LIKINGSPIELVEPEVLRYKVFEPILLLGTDKFSGVDIRIRVKGGGHVSQVYAIRQALAKAIVAWYQKCTSSRQREFLPSTTLKFLSTLSCFGGLVLLFPVTVMHFKV
jgi:small subunit ribosomal protein S16e